MAAKKRLFVMESEFATALKVILGRFTSDNDPDGLHDFGAIYMGDETFFWQIDCYNPVMLEASEDPADPMKTTRVMTVMHSRDF